MVQFIAKFEADEVQPCIPAGECRDQTPVIVIGCRGADAAYKSDMHALEPL